MPNQLQGTDEQRKNQPKDDWAKCVYESAQETARHDDTVIYEVAAIVWSANTLMMGFILEVPLAARQQRAVVATAIVGIFLTLYVPYVLWLMKKGQMTAFHLCQEIEQKFLPDWLQLHKKIDKVHVKHGGRYAVWIITVVFVCV